MRKGTLGCSAFLMEDVCMLPKASHSSVLFQLFMKKPCDRFTDLALVDEEGHGAENLCK